MRDIGVSPPRHWNLSAIMPRIFNVPNLPKERFSVCHFIPSLFWHFDNRRRH